MPVDLNWLPASIAERTTRAVESVVRGLGEKVVAILLVGPSVDPARHDGELTPELLVIANDLPVAALSNLARQVEPHVAEGVRFCLLTEQELLRSADVFTLELADYKARNVVLHGADPLEGLHFTQGELRRSIEQTLRRMVRDIREELLLGLSLDRRRGDVARALVDGVDRLVVVAHHALLMLGKEAPETEAELLTALATEAGNDIEPLLEQMRALRAGQPLERPVGALKDLLDSVQAATALIDAFGA